MSGRAIVWLPEHSELVVNFMLRGMDFPPGYMPTGDMGYSFQRLALGLVVTSPEIPRTADGVELPVLFIRTDSTGRIEVQPWGEPAGASTSSGLTEPVGGFDTETETT